VKWEDGKQADPNQDPDAHIIEKPPSSANLFQRFMEEKYNKFFFDLIRGIHPYEEEDHSSNEGVTKVTVIPEDLFATSTEYNQAFDQHVYHRNKYGLPDLRFKYGHHAPTCPVQLQSRYVSITQGRSTGHRVNRADHRGRQSHHIDGDFLSSNQFQVCFDTGCSQSITNSLDDFEEPPTQGDFGTVKTMTGTTKIKAFGIVRWVVYDVDGAARLLRVPAYYIPDSDIRLMSPQSYGQFHGWNSRVADNLGGNNFRMWLLLNVEDSAAISKLEIPISTFDNLPHFQAAPSSCEQISPETPACENKRCPACQVHAFNMDVLSNENQNLTKPQKELLLDHQ
jgi:hypothetical protein